MESQKPVHPTIEIKLKTYYYENNYFNFSNIRFFSIHSCT